jgi:pimeloyl-ACP methyl ester carboxylesterase
MSIVNDRRLMKREPMVSRHKAIVRRRQASLALLLIVPFAACTDRASMPLAGRNPREEAVRFVSGNFALAGTLVLPPGPQRRPAVVLFHGSGAQSRDLFMARWFAAQGLAALAYDKRGVGESAGDFRTGPFMELCDDGLAAIAYLKSRKDIDPQHIGVWGLSQGGWLGPLAASRSSDVTFVIAVSGPGVSPGEQMHFYYANELRARGLSEEDVREADALRRDVWNYLFTGQGYQRAKDELNRARKKRWYNQVKAQQDDLFGWLDTPSELSGPASAKINRFKREMNYDPVPALRALRVPALFLFGGQDRLVNVEESVPIIRRVLTQSGHRDFIIKVFPHDDHGMYSEMGGADGNPDPEYLETMQRWLVAHVPGSR